MITDLKNVKLDFTCKFSLQSPTTVRISYKFICTGRAIPTHIIIVVEMNVTIIAASVVVMRPCFQIVFDHFFPQSQYASHNSSSGAGSNSRGRRSGGYVRSRDETDDRVHREHSISSKVESAPGIVKTVDIELASTHASTEDILRGMLHYAMLLL